MLLEIELLRVMKEVRITGLKLMTAVAVITRREVVIVRVGDGDVLVAGQRHVIVAIVIYRQDLWGSLSFNLLSGPGQRGEHTYCH